MAAQKENWETQEVINWLQNDEGAFTTLTSLLRRSSAPIEDIHTWVRDGNAPQGLYDSLDAPPKSSLDDVDWRAVAECFID